MTTTSFVRACGLAIASLAFVPLFAQGGEEYIINGIYTPTIANVEKIELRPQSFDTILPEVNITYQMLNVKGQVPVRVDSIEATKLNIQLAQQKLYKGFVKAGFGLYTTPLFEAYYDQTRSHKNAYGLHYTHMSSNGGINDVGPSDYSFNHLDGYYSAYVQRHEITGKFLYDRRRVSYYGYASNDSIHNLQLNSQQPEEDLLKQVYNDIGFAVRVKSLYSDSTKLAHDVGLEVHNYTNLTKSRELNVKLDAKLSFEQGAETYGGDVLIDNDSYKPERGTGIVDLRQSGTLIGVSPFVHTSNNKYLVKVGAGIYVDAFGTTSFHFYPQAYLQYRLFDDILVPYAGVDGQRMRNSFRSLTQENPWLNGAPVLANSSKMYDIYGGLRGSFSRDIGFDVRISKSRIKDRPLFVNTQTSFSGVGYGDQFDVVYDDVDQLDISGEVRYSHDEHVSVLGRIDVFSYDTKAQAEAWNLPSYRLAIGANYDFQDKLVFKLEAELIGTRSIRGDGFLSTGEAGPFTDFAARTLDGYVDLHLGLEYRYTKRFSVFLDASNLSASKYERWYRYPVQRGLVLGGATYAF